MYLTKQDIKEKPKFFLSILLSKCDLITNDENTLKELEEEIISMMIDKGSDIKYKILYFHY